MASSRVQTQIRRAVHALGYIARCEASGQDVSRLAETREKATALLIRQRCCVRCGRHIENPESVKAWEQDQLGPECRTRQAVSA